MLSTGFIQIAEPPHAMTCKDLQQEQQEYVNSLHKSAEENYYKPNHPGWEVYPFDSGEFKAVGFNEFDSGHTA